MARMSDHIHISSLDQGPMLEISKGSVPMGQYHPDYGEGTDGMGQILFPGIKRPDYAVNPLSGMGTERVPDDVNAFRGFGQGPVMEINGKLMPLGQYEDGSVAGFGQYEDGSVAGFGQSEYGSEEYVGQSEYGSEEYVGQGPVLELTRGSVPMGQVLFPGIQRPDYAVNPLSDADEVDMGQVLFPGIKRPDYAVNPLSGTVVDIHGRMMKIDQYGNQIGQVLFPGIQRPDYAVNPLSGYFGQVNSFTGDIVLLDAKTGAFIPKATVMLVSGTNDKNRKQLAVVKQTDEGGRAHFEAVPVPPAAMCSLVYEIDASGYPPGRIAARMGEATVANMPISKDWPAPEPEPETAQKGKTLADYLPFIAVGGVAILLAVTLLAKK